MPEDVPAPGFTETAMEVEPAGSGHGGKCNGRLKQQRADGRTTCTQPAGWDTPHPGIGRCSRHGGATPSHVESAKQQQARDLVGTLGIVDDPSLLPPVVVHAELQLSMAKQLSAVRWLEKQVAGLPAEQVPDSPWPRLLAEHRGKADRLLVECARLGIELAAVQLEKAQGQIVIDLIERIVRRLVPDPMDPGVREIVREELTAIDVGGQAA